MSIREERIICFSLGGKRQGNWLGTHRLEDVKFLYQHLNAGEVLLFNRSCLHYPSINPGSSNRLALSMRFLPKKQTLKLRDVPSEFCHPILFSGRLMECLEIRFKLGEKKDHQYTSSHRKCSEVTELIAIYGPEEEEEEEEEE